MVTLNTTLVIELVLYLIFLWGTARFILRPVLRNIDAREESVEGDRTQAAENTEAAQQLEGEYSEAWADIRHAAEESYRAAHAETTKGHFGAVEDAHRQADEAVAKARGEALKTVEKEMGALEASVPEMADFIADRLRPGGSSS